MPVSPQDYALWAAATGNKYPTTPQEKARLAPEVYDFNRGFGKFQGFNSFEGFQGDIVYDQPQSIRHYGDNSLLQSPITPDNNVPKVAGQLNNTLTGQHYTQHYADDATATGFGGMAEPRSLLEKAALGALGAGVVAAGVYGAQRATGRDLGVGKVGGMVRNLGKRAKSGLKSALGLADEAAGPSFVTRQAVDETLATAQQGISAIDDVAPGIVREQNVIPVNIRATQQAKSTIPDPWGESALGQAGQTMSAPAMQSVVPTQTGVVGVDPDIAERVSAFTQKIGAGAPITAVPSALPLPSASKVSVMGRFPGAEGSSAAGVTFTPVQGAIEGRPARYTVLPTEPRIGETITEFVQRPIKIDGRWTTKYDPVSVFQNPIEEGAQEAAQLTGLLSPQRPMPTGALVGGQRSFSTDPRVATAQKQAEAIFQATGDPSVIRGAYGEATSMPTRVVLPSGESVPTGSLYEAFGITRQPVIDKYTGVTTYSGPPTTQVRAESLQAALNMQSAMKARALEQLGVPSTYQPSQAQLQQLAPSTKKMLTTTAQAAEDASNRLAQAEANQLLYKLRPEVTEGIREVPVISELSGEVVGSRVVPEVQGLPTSEYYQMRARGGAGRQEVGGVGRRREAIEGLEGLTFGVGQGSMEDVTPVLYKGIDDVTGRQTVFRPEDVSPVQIATGAVTPIRGTAVEPQRIMGREGRTFKGVAANVIDPGSFNPAILEQIAEATPERIDPSTGLAYSQQAMGGEKAAQRRRQIEAMRQSGQRVRGRMGTELPASIVRGGAISESGVDPALGTRFARRGRAPEGSARAQQIELMRQRDELVRQALSGESNFPVTQQTAVVPKYTPAPGATYGQATPRQRAFRLYSELVGDPAAMI